LASEAAVLWVEASLQEISNCLSMLLIREDTLIPLALPIWFDDLTEAPTYSRDIPAIKSAALLLKFATKFVPNR
jgi:hypothetical protein